MKAAVHTRYGPPDVVRISEVAKPTPHDNELLVKVHATTVNRTDAHYRAAKPFIMRFVLSGVFRPKATVLGNEFAGVVEAVGSSVTTFQAGDRVFGYHEGPFGCHAEFLVVRDSSPVAVMPDTLDFDEAAPATEGSHYALSHINRARIGPGQHVLVYGATGGIGSAAVQLLRSMGVYVTAVCGPHHQELVKGLGAAQVLDYTTEDFASHDQRYDVVFDAVGKISFGESRRLLKPGGIYMSTGPGPGYQNLLLPLITPIFRREKVLFAFPRCDQATVRYFGELMELGQFRPVIDRTYALDQIVEAYRYVETGQKIGNVVISVDQSA